MKVYLVGVGPGSSATMTLAAREAIAASPLLIGAPRLLAGYDGKTCLPLIAAGDIAAAIDSAERGPAAVLLSGDVGFYSGAKNLYPLLSRHEVETIPGVSSLVYFCARLRIPWQDVFLVSAHGRSHNAPGAVQSHQRTFVLTGGNYRAGDLCAQLTEWGLGHVTVHVGERLSYPDERIVTGAAEELAGREFDSLAVVLAENPAPIHRPYSAPALPDSAFFRGKVPMTKEEVRSLVLSKLRLLPSHTLWDVGAGTGSVSAEGALAVPEGRVFAVERKEEALALLERNKAALGLTNLHIVPGTAPEALADLPAPDRVFLGGSSGNMEELLRCALDKNPAVRIVVTAVTLETVAETVQCFARLELTDTDMVQIAATRVREAGRYHLMDAQNPVWVLAGETAAGPAASHGR